MQTWRTLVVKGEVLVVCLCYRDTGSQQWPIDGEGFDRYEEVLEVFPGQSSPCHSSPLFHICIALKSLIQSDNCNLFYLISSLPPSLPFCLIHVLYSFAEHAQVWSNTCLHRTPNSCLCVDLDSTCRFIWPLPAVVEESFLVICVPPCLAQIFLWNHISSFTSVYLSCCYILFHSESNVGTVLHVSLIWSAFESY